ncbi:hypothetical protein Phum_PHUM269700 [Pediculus humanus corporis]|uniref:Uncharacterized protein n=1 Tax=Pediculus humanus subsp. corporis TaxID=121224 RepID=E0VKV1_PEDHC|nr:uncharacterized protein Phum_PHUM269700 [Pediculus humanus corporis]EEB14007.1 hypothetical protein Phum_PHUM269700 [Pediculus humanus corporis]
MKTNDNNNRIYIDNELGEEKDFACGFSEYRCSGDPVSQNLMNLEIMVSDLEERCGEGGTVSTNGGHYGAHKSNAKEICASGIQYEISCCESQVGVCRRDKNVLTTVDNMLVTVEGTLEPRDSHEGTQLVSPDTSLDLNDNPVRLSGQNRGVEPGPSSGNVSVVNCYRAVPVSVVSTVPTIKCLNTQENISNVHIIQTSSSSEQKLSNTSGLSVQSKRLPVRSDNVSNAGHNGGQCVGPSTSRARTKVPRDVSRIQNRHSVNGEQNAVIRCAPTKIERERPKSMNSCASEITPDQSNAAPNLCETLPTSSNNNSSILLSNHNRSVSNPVLGNQAKPLSNRYGSHQNIPIRLETHFGPNSSDGTERSQTYVSQRIVTNSDSHHQGQERPPDQNAGNTVSSPRTYTSTEAQTDDVSLGIHPQINREQRRRERRERRHQRRLHQSVLNSGSVWQSNVDVVHRDRRGLPDILNSHMPPPYSAVPVPAIPAMPSPMHVPPPLPVAPGPQTMPHLVDSSPGQPLPHQNGLRFLFPFPGGRR